MITGRYADPKSGNRPSQKLRRRTPGFPQLNTAEIGTFVDRFAQYIAHSGNNSDTILSGDRAQVPCTVGRGDHRLARHKNYGSNVVICSLLFLVSPFKRGRE